MFCHGHWAIPMFENWKKKKLMNKITNWIVRSNTDGLSALPSPPPKVNKLKYAFFSSEGKKLKSAYSIKHRHLILEETHRHYRNYKNACPRNSSIFYFTNSLICYLLMCFYFLAQICWKLWKENCEKVFCIFCKAWSKEPPTWEPPKTSNIKYRGEQPFHNVAN